MFLLLTFLTVLIEENSTSGDHKDFLDLAEELDKPVFLYNCYLPKYCKIFKTALSKYNNSEIFVIENENKTIDNYFKLFFEPNISLSIPKITHENEITDVIDFFLERNTKNIENYDFENSRYFSIIGPKSDIEHLREMAIDAIPDIGFVDVVCADEEYGYKFFNPHEKLIHSFDGTFFSFKAGFSKRIESFGFREMFEHKALSLVVMNTDPSNEVRESLYELKCVFPKLTVVIPTPETYEDLRFITNTSCFGDGDFLMIHVGLGVFVNTSMKELSKLVINSTVFDINETSWANKTFDEDDYDYENMTTYGTPQPQPSPTITYDNYKHYNGANNYENRRIRDGMADYFGDMYNDEMEMYGWDLDYERYGRRGMYNDIERYDFLGTDYWEYNDDYSSGWSKYPYATSIDFNESGEPLLDHISIKNVSTYDIAFLGGPGRSRRNVIAKMIRKKLAPKKGVSPMSTLARQLNKWITKQNNTANWKKIHANIDYYMNDPVILKTSSYPEFIDSYDEHAILYMDSTGRSLEMERHFLKLLDQFSGVSGLKQIKFAIVDAEYNHLEYTPKGTQIPLTFKVPLPFVAISPKMWHEYIPLIAKTPEEVDNLMGEYRRRKTFKHPHDFFMMFENNQTQLEKFMNIFYKKKTNGKNVSTLSVNYADDMFYWNFEYYREK